jgi:hypothetical protein
MRQKSNEKWPENMGRSGAQKIFSHPALGTPNAKIALGTEAPNTCEQAVPQSIQKINRNSKMEKYVI